MEEQNKEVSEKEQKTKEGGSSRKKELLPMRSCILMLLAGVYLLYTGSSLCKSVINGEEGAHWGFLLAGVVFLVLSVGMLFVGIRTMYLRNKEKAAAEAAAAAETNLLEKTEEESAFKEPEQAQPQNFEQNKKMSISQRAKLTERLEEEE